MMTFVSHGFTFRIDRRGFTVQDIVHRCREKLFTSKIFNQPRARYDKSVQETRKRRRRNHTARKGTCRASVVISSHDLMSCGLFANCSDLEASTCTNVSSLPTFRDLIVCRPHDVALSGCGSTGLCTSKEAI